MPILFCEKAESREASVDMELSKYSVRLNKSFSRTYIVLGSSLEEQEITIAGAYGLPRVGTTSDEFNDYLETASSSAELIYKHVSRIRDLCEQACNGTYGEQSKNAIKAEVIVSPIDKL